MMNENKQIKSTPEKYIEQYLPNIIDDCDRHEISKPDAINIFEVIKSTIYELDKIKQIPEASRQFIREQLPHFEGPKEVLFQNWLTMALKQEDLFTYSYNALAMKQNREAGQVLYNIKEIEPIFFHPEDHTKDSSIKLESQKVPDKFYALLHLILIAIGNEHPTGNKSKKEIIALGQNKYNTGQGFYKWYRDIDVLNMIAFVRSLSKKERSNWKEIITEISGNDADVLAWINKQPN